MTLQQFLDSDAAQQALAYHSWDGDETQAFHARVALWIDALSTERPRIQRYDGATVEEMSDHDRHAGALLRAVAAATERARALRLEEENDCASRARATHKAGYTRLKMTTLQREHAARAAEQARLAREARAAKSGA